MEELKAASLESTDAKKKSSAAAPSAEERKAKLQELKQKV